MIAAAATRGDVTVDNVIPKHLEAVTAKLQEMGVHVYEMDESIRVVGQPDLRECRCESISLSWVCNGSAISNG